MNTDELEAGLFFIVGAPRSGTTLLQSILSAHSTIYIPPETEFFMRFAAPFDAAADDPQRFAKALDAYFASRRWQDQGIPLPEMTEALEQCDKSARGIFLALMQRHAARSGKPRIGEKSPHHCRHVEQIGAIFPQAKFIHLLRDPRDVVASRLTMPWTTGSHLATAREWQRITAHHLHLTQTLPPATYTALPFEALVEDPEAEISRLCEFLGIAFETEMLNRTKKSAAESSSYSAREQSWKSRAEEPITKTRVGVYEQSLSLRQIHGIERICTSEMDFLHYPRTNRTVITFRWAILNGLDHANDLLRRWGRSLTKRFRRARD